ncbi:exosome complex exonuclease, putative [Eimeria acervulina]|uniref:Ribosomal RNA-processing protein 42 n=1 Tax=Eimeria acervulina TaxID=5801 RepID=U6GVK2_EIMAC|nr:exosome complex exonuclease, putative [Eimeria acervulina]CDI82569.1 exosome complex exonuclease, putative [Eimeria acervulina]
MQSYLEEEAAKSPSLSLWAGEETGDSRGRLQQQLQQQRQQQQQRRCPLVGAAEQELAEVTGGDGGSLSTLLQAMLEQLLLPHLKPLTDANGRPQWRISIDVIVLKAGGCLLDAVSMAIWGALKALKLPNVFVEEEEEKDQGLARTEYKVSCDERISAGKPFPIETVPILITAAQIGDTYLWDLTEVEAACGDSFLVAAFLPSGACVGLQKFGHVLADCRTLQTTLAFTVEEVHLGLCLAVHLLAAENSTEGLPVGCIG